MPTSCAAHPVVPPAEAGASLAVGEPGLAQRALVALQWSYAGAVLRALGQIVVQLLLARLLGPEDFGRASAALLVLSIGWILSEGGFGSALVQKARLDDADVGYALGWVLLLSGSAGALVVLAAPWLAAALGDPSLTALVRACGALIPLQAASNLPASLMRRNLDMRRAQLVYLGGYVAAYGAVGLPLAAAGAGPWSLVAAFGTHALSTLLGSYAVVRHTLRPRLRGDAGIAHFGLQVTGSNLANWALENVDRLLVNRFWGSTALGAWSAALSLSRAPANFLVGSLQSVTFASAARLQDDPARLARSFVALLALVLLATGPAAALLALHAGAVVRLAFGSQWQQAGPLLAAFFVALPLYAVLSITGPLLWALQAVRTELAAQLAGVALVVAGLLLARAAPLEQAVWVLPAVYALRVLWLVAALCRRLGIAAGRLWRALAGAVLLSAAAFALGLLATRLLPPLAALAASLPLAAALGLWAVRQAPRTLLSPELAELLRQRAPESALVRRLCRLFALRAA